MRYQLMKSGNTLNSKYNLNYPDPLTLNYNYTFSNPDQRELTVVDIDRLDIFFFLIYGRMDYMGIVLDLNNISHRSELSPGDILILPNGSELDDLVLRRRLSDTG